MKLLIPNELAKLEGLCEVRDTLTAKFSDAPVQQVKRSIRCASSRNGTLLDEVREHAFVFGCALCLTGVHLLGSSLNLLSTPACDIEETPNANFSLDSLHDSHGKDQARVGVSMGSLGSQEASGQGLQDHLVNFMHAPHALVHFALRRVEHTHSLRW